ncbi:hypothetical protein B0H14DRAFT_2887182 [Mycena olivaceomarginata]|nr:hypothetical protein B0H14DRAFT_2887182 [Mycena olivaceomarginata]
MSQLESKAPDERFDDLISEEASRALARFSHLLATNSPPSEVEVSDILNFIDANSKVIGQLNSDIEPLLVKRNALESCTRSLGLLLSANRTLPFDVLAQIFARTVDLDADPWRLAQICRRWRAIALGCPNLWATIDIDHGASNTSMRPSGYPLDKLQSVLERSATYPLSVRFCTVVKAHDDAPVSFDADRLFGVLVAHSERWESLFLRCTPRLFPLLAQVKGKLPMLRRLALDMCFDAIALDAFETAPLLSSLDLTGGFRIAAPCTILLPWAHITRYYGDFSMWDDHVTALEHLRNVIDCAITLNNWAPNENEDILDLPRLRRLYVARGDFLEFTAPLLQELVVEPLQMTPPADVLTNISDLISRSSCQLTKLCLISAIPSRSDVQKLISVLQLLPSLADVCILSRKFNEHMNLDELVTALAVATPCILPRMERLTIGGYAFYEWSALVDMVDGRLHANPLVCSAIRGFALLHRRLGRPMPREELLRLEMLRSAGLDLTVIEGPGAHEAMVNVPFFRAGTSSGMYWAPEHT